MAKQLKAKSQPDYTFKGECDVCGEKPILRDVGMCSTCTFGERGSMWEWLDDFPTGEGKLAEKYILNMLEETHLVEKDGTVNPVVAMLLHIDQDVLDKIERIM